MVEIVDRPSPSIGRELGVTVLRVVRASSRSYIGLHVPWESRDKPALFFPIVKTRHRPSKASWNPGHCPANESFWTAMSLDSGSMVGGGLN